MFEARDKETNNLVIRHENWDKVAKRIQSYLEKNQTHTVLLYNETDLEKRLLREIFYGG